MGSPLAPILANWFVSKVETKLLDNPLIKPPKFYRRYVDDIFAVFENEKDRDVFYNHLNSAHKNLRFTMENVDTASKSLPFLDTKISINQHDQFETRVYRKPTNTNVIMNFQATAPSSWKKGIIECFLARAKKVSSTAQIFEEEISFLKKLFISNGYPLSFIENTITSFVNSTNASKTKVLEEDSPENTIEEYFVVPYIGKASEKLCKRVKVEMLQHNVNIRSAYRTTKVGSHLSLKQPVPTLFKANVVYQFKCPYEKDTRYIGETQRQFYKRIIEHTTTTSSAVHEHIQRCNGCLADDTIIKSFSIIRKCDSSCILSEEAIFIKKLEPNLNVQMGPFKGARVPTTIFN